MEKRTLALLKVHGTAVLFGASVIFGALIQSSAETIVLGRVMIAFAIISLYFLWKKQPLVKLNLQQMAQLAFSAALLAAHWVTFFVAVKVGGVAVATLGFASFPAFVALFESLSFREKLRFREVVLLIAITVGLILVTPEFTFGNQATQGLLWGVLSALVYGILAVANRRTMSKISGVQASWWQYIFATLFLLPLSITEFPSVSTQDWFWIFCIGFLCTTLAYTLFISSLDTINARTASMIISLEPVYAIVIAWLCFNEVPTLKMIIGGLIILLSVAWANLKK
ncbi:DMT family transporter [Mannheimia haemolytica]|uniref:DMT family transporter n=1 Tax=Mannheimia haemolytica TaxID=75985 RepID=UPI000588A28A|nr:DMT family transporter [Mannheimia haemolytica]AJE08957.1 EamA/RhaT family transporter [Mannheimia haemolytica USDA-ARS-USMARC-184]UQX62522.1 DMT family transporter [Mannheimia haemolytica]